MQLLRRAGGVELFHHGLETTQMAKFHNEPRLFRARLPISGACSLLVQANSNHQQ